MSYQIIVQELGTDNVTGVERYRQIVDNLDLLEVIEVVNKKPRKIRADRGAKRTETK